MTDTTASDTTYYTSIRVYEMGEDVFLEESHDTLGAALATASAWITKYIVNDPTLDEWCIVDLTGGDPRVKFEVQYTCTELMDGDDTSTDYIMQVMSVE